jgi:hypothetical protein
MKLSRLFFIILATITLNSYSQIAELPSKKDTVSYWKSKNTIGFDLNEIAFVNWSAGGNSSVSGILKGNFTRSYLYKNIKWYNELIVRYGVNKQDGLDVRKTDDVLSFASTFGHRKDSISNWFHSAKFNFNSQFTNGYAYPNTSYAISKPFAPAYSFLGVGTEYANKEKKFIFYFSPFTMKNTFVFDQRLANQGAFGVKKAEYDSNGNLVRNGELSKSELGVLITNFYKKELFKNITLENRLSLYSDYINKFGNIDIDWQLQLDLVVNDYVRATIATHLLYDDDIKSKKQVNGQQVIEGPKAQLKQLLGVGIIYSF